MNDLWGPRVCVRIDVKVVNKQNKKSVRINITVKRNKHVRICTRVQYIRESVY